MRAATFAKTKSLAAMSAEERAALKAKQDAQRKDQSHFSSFPVDAIAVVTENDRAKVVLLNAETGAPDPKNLAIIQLPAFRTVPPSRMNGEGNCGQGEYAPVRGDAKFSLSLALGHCTDKRPLSPIIAAEQEAAVKVLMQASANALGAWFDSNAIKECSSGYAGAYTSARAAYAAQHFSGASANDIIKKEAANGEVKAAVAAQARKIFIETGLKPFGEKLDDAGVKMTPMAFINRAVWKMGKGKYVPGMPMSRPKGPTVEVVKTANESMPRLRRMMAQIGYEFNPPEYQNGNLAPNHVKRILRAPKVQVPDLDDLGNPILVAGQPSLVWENDIFYDPLFETSTGKKLASLVQCSVLLSLSNGGQKGNYGVKLTLASPLVIIDQGERSAQELFQYDPELAPGLFVEDEPEPEAEPVPEAAPEAVEEVEADVIEEVIEEVVDTHKRTAPQEGNNKRRK